MKNIHLMLFLTVLPFYLAAMEKVEKPLPRHQLKDLRAYQLYASLLQHALPQDVTNLITQFMMKLEYGSQEDFIQQLIIKKIPHTEIQQKEWKLPRLIHESFDKKYYVSFVQNNIVTLYDHKTKDVVFTIPNCAKYTLFKTKNALIPIPLYTTISTTQNLVLYDLDTQTPHILMTNIQDIIDEYSECMHVSPDEKCIIVTENNKIHLWDITDINNITQTTYDNFNAKHIAFSPDNILCASSSSTNDKTVIDLWKRENKGLTFLCSYIESFPHSYLAFTNQGKQLIIGKDTYNQQFYHMVGIKSFVTSREIKYSLKKIEHREGCWRNTWYQSDVGEWKRSLGHTTSIFSSQNDNHSDTLAVYDSPEISIYLNNNVYTMHSSGLALMTNISPDEKTMTLIMRKSEHDGDQEKIIVIDSQKTHLICDWSPKRYRYHDDITPFNKTSTLFLCNIRQTAMRPKIEYTYILRNRQGKEIKNFTNHTNCPATFHPNGRSILTNNAKFKLYSKKDEKTLEKMATFIPLNNYLLFNEVVCHNGLLNAFHKHTFDQLSSDEQTFCIESFKHIDFVKK